MGCVCARCLQVAIKVRQGLLARELRVAGLRAFWHGACTGSPPPLSLLVRSFWRGARA